MNGIELVFYKDIQDEKLVLPETSELLFENAKEKASAAAKKFNMLALGDDSGLYIRALCYFPGVHSRRWIGAEGDDRIRNIKIIGYMHDETDKSAELISCFSLVDPLGNELFKTKVNNNFTVAEKLNGSYGFGYDAILIPNYENVENAFKNNKITKERFDEIIEKKLTIAELSQYEKNVINYRGRIAKEMITVFSNNN